MTRITATEASRSFSELLNRARYGGESFVVVRGGEEMAQITPITERPAFTLSELLDYRLQFPADPEFADDLEAVHSEQESSGEGPWGR